MKFRKSMRSALKVALVSAFILLGFLLGVKSTVAGISGIAGGPGQLEPANLPSAKPFDNIGKKGSGAVVEGAGEAPIDEVIPKQQDGSGSGGLGSK